MSEKKALSQEEKLERIKKQQLSFRANSLNREVAENLSEEEQVAVAIIGRELSKNGLSTKEACKVANISYEAFKYKYENNETFRKIIDFKKLEYKRDMMSTVHAAIRNGDSKEAARMLERIFPEEYGGKNSEEQQDNLLREAIQFVRENSDIEPLVSEKNSETKKEKTPEEKKKQYERELANLLT